MFFTRDDTARCHPKDQNLEAIILIVTSVRRILSHIGIFTSTKKSIFLLVKCALKCVY